MAERTLFGWFRLAILLAVLAFVVLNTWHDRLFTTDWDLPLRVTIYPIAAPGDDTARGYVSRLDVSDFDELGEFFVAQAGAYHVELDEPVRLRVSHAVREPPPALADHAGFLSVVLWSLRLRYWAWRVGVDDPLPTPDVQVFALYQSGQDGVALPDSVGLSKGLMAIAHLYADTGAAGPNQVVVAHELLHTLGATDKYDFASGQPLAPDGLGEPDLRPQYPQTQGEIMAGRIAVSAREAVIPSSLGSMRVGLRTAREIGWLE